MPLHKRVIGSQGKAPQQSADKATAVKNRRRDIYKQQSTDKKEALLLQRRTRRQESNNQNFLPGCLTPPLNTQVRLTGQRGITIRELPSEPQTGNTSCDDTSTAMQGKGKTIISPFCIFEAGSTSATAVIHHNPNSRSATHRGSSSLATQQHDPKATTGKTKGGSGKTFLYRALLATIRSKGFIALATATSGVAASILPGGRTAHSRFKIPINIDGQFSCNISYRFMPHLSHRSY